MKCILCQKPKGTVNLLMMKMLNAQTAVLPTPSRAVYVTTVSPGPNESDGLWVVERDTSEKSSLAMGGDQATMTEVTAAATRLVMLEGQSDMVGGVESVRAERRKEST